MYRCLVRVGEVFALDIVKSNLFFNNLDTRLIVNVK